MMREDMMREDIEDIKKEVTCMKNEETLAFEMFKEMKKDNKRKTIIIIVLIALLFATNIGWLVYKSQFETVETSTMELLQEDVNYSNQSGVIN